MPTHMILETGYKTCATAPEPSTTDCTDRSEAAGVLRLLCRLRLCLACGTGAEGHCKPGMGSDGKAWRSEQSFNTVSTVAVIVAIIFA